MTDALFGEVEASVVVGGAVFGALFGEMWNEDQRQMLYFTEKMSRSNIAPATKNQIPTSPNTVPANLYFETCHD